MLDTVIARLGRCQECGLRATIEIQVPTRRFLTGVISCIASIHTVAHSLRDDWPKSIVRDWVTRNRLVDNGTVPCDGAQPSDRAEQRVVWIAPPLRVWRPNNHSAFGDRMDIEVRLGGRSGYVPVLPISPESEKSVENCHGRTLILSGDGITPPLCHAIVARALFRTGPAFFSWRGSAMRVIFRLVRSRTALPPGVAGVGIGI
jgi:hypothetical protein